MGLGDIHISYQYYWLTSWDVYLHIYSSFFQNWIVKNHCMQINTSYQNFSLENIQKIVVLLYNTTAIFLASAELVKSAYLEGNVPQHNKKKIRARRCFRWQITTTQPTSLITTFSLRVQTVACQRQLSFMKNATPRQFHHLLTFLNLIITL